MNLDQNFPNGSLTIDEPVCLCLHANKSIPVNGGGGGRGSKSKGDRSDSVAIY